MASAGDVLDGCYRNARWGEWVTVEGAEITDRAVPADELKRWLIHPDGPSVV